MTHTFRSNPEMVCWKGKYYPRLPFFLSNQMVPRCTIDEKKEHTVTVLEACCKPPRENIDVEALLFKLESEHCQYPPEYRQWIQVQWKAAPYQE